MSSFWSWKNSGSSANFRHTFHKLYCVIDEKHPHAFCLFPSAEKCQIQMEENRLQIGLERDQSSQQEADAIHRKLWSCRWLLRPFCSTGIPVVLLQCRLGSACRRNKPLRRANCFRNLLDPHSLEWNDGICSATACYGHQQVASVQYVLVNICSSTDVILSIHNVKK